VTVRALVTGGNGFVAQWAMRAMLDRDWTVTAAGIGTVASTVLDRAQHAAIQWRTMDVTRPADVAETIEAARPDMILHLAAVSHVPDAASDPAYAFGVNAGGTVRLLAEVQRQRAAGAADPLVLVVGSAEQYGRHAPNEMPLAEGAEQRPLTLYAASKVAQEVAALQAFRSQGVRVICTRSFNHSGIGQAGNFLLPGLVARAKALPRSGGRLSIGNGGTIRDFLHVADVVDAYLSLLDSPAAGEVYNVASGQGVSVRDLAAAVLQHLGVTADITSDPALARPIDVPVLVGDNSKLRRATGWAPRRTRDDIINDLIHAPTR
jgi:GDP-4-dehydro-6-deoxy-D-mannose reductase